MRTWAEFKLLTESSNRAVVNKISNVKVFTYQLTYNRVALKEY